MLRPSWYMSSVDLLVAPYQFLTVFRTMDMDCSGCQYASSPSCAKCYLKQRMELIQVVWLDPFHKQTFDTIDTFSHIEKQDNDCAACVCDELFSGSPRTTSSQAV